jgi:hypothetical protein
MAGVRATHPTARNVRFTIVERDRPYPEPYTCPSPLLGGCGSTHLFKTHHLNLDETGSVIVNAVLYSRIRPLLELNGFSNASEVPKPPTMDVGLFGNLRLVGTAHHIPIVQGKDS